MTELRVDSPVADCFVTECLVDSPVTDCFVTECLVIGSALSGVEWRRGVLSGVEWRRGVLSGATSLLKPWLAVGRCGLSLFDHRFGALPGAGCRTM